MLRQQVCRLGLVHGRVDGGDDGDDLAVDDFDVGAERVVWLHVGQHAREEEGVLADALRGRRGTRQLARA